MSLSERLERKVEAMKESLPKDKPHDYYVGMLFGYRQAVITMHGNVDVFTNEEQVWDNVTLTALAIERKAKETK